MPEPLDHPRYAAVGLICAMLGGLFGAALVHTFGKQRLPATCDTATIRQISDILIDLTMVRRRIDNLEIWAETFSKR